MVDKLTFATHEGIRVDWKYEKGSGSPQELIMERASRRAQSDELVRTTLLGCRHRKRQAMKPSISLVGLSLIPVVIVSGR